MTRKEFITCLSKMKDVYEHSRCDQDVFKMLLLTYLEAEDFRNTSIVLNTFADYVNRLESFNVDEKKDSENK